MSDLPVGILLAAGQSSRFGQNKLVYQLPESQISMAVQSAQALLKVLPKSIAVVREDDQELKALLSITGISIVDNFQAETGISSSIRYGISASNSSTSGWVIALADMPYIPDTIIRQIAKAVQQGALICRIIVSGI